MQRNKSTEHFSDEFIVSYFYLKINEKNYILTFLFITNIPQVESYENSSSSIGVLIFLSIYGLNLNLKLINLFCLFIQKL